VTREIQPGGVATSVVGDGPAPLTTDAAVTGASSDGTADTVPSGASAGPALCTTLADGSGYCAHDDERPGLFLSGRGPSGQTLVHDLPASTFAVTFQSGGVRYWERPLHGVALFPYPADAATTATYAAIDATGTFLAGDAATNATMTDAEVAAATVTTATGDTIPGGWFVDTMPGTGLGGEVVRLVGRTTPLGFGGPFSDQAYVVGQTAPEQWVDVITIRTADIAAVDQRLAAAAGGSVRHRAEVAPGVTVLVWATDEVPAVEIDRAVATLRQRDPEPVLAIDLDRPFAFTGPRAYSFIGSSPARRALTSDTVATTGDGRRVVGVSDDVGDVDFSVQLSTGITNATRVGPHVPDPKRLPAVGDNVFRGLWAVPAGTTSVRLTLDDATVVIPEVIDVSLAADAVLLFVPDDHGAHLVTAVDATTR
jgi:hypothetical protein